MRTLPRTVALFLPLVLAVGAAAPAAAQDAPANWWERLTFRGDLRTRYEGFFQDGADTRGRLRFRFRLGMNAKVSNDFDVGIRMASGVPGSITSTNQTLDDAFTPKSFHIDRAYLRYRPRSVFGSSRPVLSLMAGKFGSRYERPAAGGGSELMYDSDLSPEGLSQEFLLVDRKDGALRRLALVTEQWVIDESSRAADAWLLLHQAQASFALGGNATLKATGGLVLGAREDALARARNDNDQLVLTNGVRLRDGTVVPGGQPYTPNAANPIDGFQYGFTILNGTAELEVTPKGWSRPLGFFATLAHNSDAPRENQAWQTGVSLGDPGAPGEWGVSATWLRVETDAVPSAITWSDMGRGGTNVQGVVLQADVVISRGVTFTLTDHIARLARTATAGAANPSVHRVHVALQASF